MIISLKPHYSVVPDVKLPEKLTQLKLETVDLSITDSPPAFTTSRPDSPGKSKKNMTIPIEKTEKKIMLLKRYAFYKDINRQL